MNMGLLQQELHVVNDNLVAAGLDYCFGTYNGRGARDIIKRCKALCRAHAHKKVVQQSTGGGMDLPQDPNKWPDPEELHRTAFGSLFRNASVEEKTRNDGLVYLIRSSLEWEYDGWTSAATAAAEATAL